MSEYNSIPQNPPPSQYVPPSTQGQYIPMHPVSPETNAQQIAPNPNIQPSPYAQQAYGVPPPHPGYGPGPFIGGIQYVYCADPMTELNYSTGVLIRQQPQFFEMYTGCESPNRYYVFSQSSQGGMKLLFKCKEISGCCMRNCCPANSREFNMVIKHIANSTYLDDNFQKTFVNVVKPFKCTCCCLERPEMMVTFSESNQPLGKIKQPFTCCDPKITLYDNDGDLKYTIHADCCQCGILCASNFFGKMSEAVFNIYKSNNLTEPPCGTIIKKSANFAELITTADSYQINFPPESTPNDKMNLIAAGLMIDYQFFEEKAEDHHDD